MTTISITEKDLVFLMGALEIGMNVICSDNYENFYNGENGKDFDSKEKLIKNYDKLCDKISNAEKRMKKKNKKNK
jgi:hypothetical protein